MSELSWMQEIIATVAVICGGVCFLVYLALTLNWIKPAAQRKVEEGFDQALNAKRAITGMSAKDLAELVKALASLTDSLVKAGPALWSLIGSALFLLIATAAVGVFSGNSNGRTDGDSSQNTAAQNDQASDEENLPVRNDTAAP
jgi:hypothetical protein